MDAGTIKLFGAIILFSAVAFAGTSLLAGRMVAGRVVTKGQAQFVSALLGLALGIFFLLALG